MRYIAYISDHCATQAKKYDEHNTIIRIAEKLESDQTVANWGKFIYPLIKKDLGKSYRLLADKMILEDEGIIVIRFLTVIPRGQSEYDRFLANPQRYTQQLHPPDDAIYAYLRETDIKEVEPIDTVSSTEYRYLYTNINMLTDAVDVIYESKYWVETINLPDRRDLLVRYYDLITEIIEQPVNSSQTFRHCSKSSATVLYRRLDSQRLFLIAPMTEDDLDDDEFLSNFDEFLGDTFDNISTEELLRHSRRSYPTLVTTEGKLWRIIQKSETGNLALSPEEADILTSIHMRDDDTFSYPLFINGRPGSGKSTILQYLFAEHLYFHIKSPDDERCDFPPIYLTYGQKLLEAAKTAVTTILSCNSALAIENTLDLTVKQIADAINDSFAEFHSFLYAQLSPYRQALYPSDRRIDFSQFRNLWLEKSRANPDMKIRSLSPELVWHIIRTYIKGMRDDMGNFLDNGAYAELSAGQQTVSQETFDLVFETVWQNWYKILCEEEGYWDTQDLTRAVLDDDSIDLSRYPVVFCDEAQDFTEIELEVIFKFSLFSRRLIEPELLDHVPFAFAGDPFQTLNPTGFDWDAVKSSFHEKIVQGLDRYGRSTVNFNYRELKSNYRSTDNVVKFCNLIQLIRGILFENKEATPQEVYFKDEGSPIPVFFDVEDPICMTKLREQAEIVVILPCQEGEERAYIQQDPFLKSLSDSTEGYRNFLSPMSAKGLEFSRVVLYKFGHDYVTNYPELLIPLMGDNNPHTDGKTLLPMQYYINRLYVGASRAMKRLIIVDTAEGIDYLWDRKELRQFNELVQKHPSQDDWDVKKHLSFVSKGIETSWSEDRDDPLTLAINFYEAGLSERDPYKLRLAANNYQLADNNKKAKECYALCAEFENNLTEAGEYYLELRDKHNALRCFWQARNYQQVIKTADPNTAKHRAAEYMAGTKGIRNSVTFLNYIHSHINQPLWNSIITSSHWHDVINTMSSALSEHESASEDWHMIYAKLASLDNAGIPIQVTRELGNLAYRAGRYEKAVDIWDRTGATKPELLHDAKARINPYPYNLEWLDNLKRYDAIVEEWKASTLDQLPDTAVDYILFALLELNYTRDLLDLLARYPSEERYKESMSHFKRQRDNKSVENLAKQLVVYRCQNANWQRAIDLTEDNRLSKKIRLKLHPLIIQQAAISTTLVNDTRRERTFVGEYLRIMLIEHTWQDIVSIQVAGTAIEKAGHLVNSLEFYELIWRSETIESTDEEMQFARRRWLKVKDRQAKYSKENGRNDDWQLQARDATNKARQWSITQATIPEYAEVTLRDTETVRKPQPQETDTEKIQAILDLHSSGWDSERIATLMKIDVRVVQAILEGHDH